ERSAGHRHPRPHLQRDQRRVPRPPRGRDDPEVPGRRRHRGRAANLLRAGPAGLPASRRRRQEASRQPHRARAL
ncbi:MAG: hypothetical protein AVDCRST_MAG76-3700, partial [uncultured Acidimicrobiales bacterium]